MTAAMVPSADNQGAKVLMNCQVSLSIIGAMIAKRGLCRNVSLWLSEASSTDPLPQAPRLLKAMRLFFTLAVQSLRGTVRVLVRTGKGIYEQKGCPFALCPRRGQIPFEAPRLEVQLYGPGEKEGWGSENFRGGTPTYVLTT
jgi:hypothetical protein